jgi:hypothetical protein
VTPCPYYEDVVGSTRQASLRDVWFGPGFERIRTGMRERDLPGACRHCCGFAEGGSVDDFPSHWFGERGLRRPLLPIAMSR